MMQQMCRHAPTWYDSSNCLFVRAVFLDIVSLCGMTMLRQTGAVSIMYAWNDLAGSVFVGPEYSIGPNGHHGDDLYRTSLAQVFFIDRVIMRDDSLGVMASNEYQSIGSALMLLATEDADTCLAALDTLDAIIQSKPTLDLTIPLSLVLSHIHRVVLSASDAEVISKAQSVLSSALTNQALHADFFTQTTEDQVLLTLDRLEEQCLSAPQSNMQSGLHLLSFFLDHAYTTLAHQRARILPAIARYIRLLRQTILDTNPFDTRSAAIQSLHALPRILTARATSAATGPLIMSFSLILYDLLHDDDDEIRDLAAATAGVLLRAQGVVFKDTVPILTSHHLLLYFSRAFTRSADLVREAMSRVTSTGTTTATKTKDTLSAPFAQTLAEERKQDTSLFAQEKQNLYKDDVLDTLLWSRLLLLLPSSSIPPPLHAALPQWVITALNTLTETAATESDGALGWTSKAEVFTLGMRVFCAAEVVLTWHRARDDTEKSDVMVALRRFADTGAQNGVHGLWIERVEGVLERRVCGVVAAVGESLGGVL